MRFKVRIDETWSGMAEYEVDADTPDQAVEKINEGEADLQKFSADDYVESGEIHEVTSIGPSSNLPKVDCPLVGEDGNAFAILGRFKQAANKAAWPETDIDKIVSEAMSGDYDHLLATLSKYCA